MNTLDKVYNLTVDIKNIDTKYNSYAKFFDDDRETSVIKVKILNNNSPIDLENCSVEAYFVLANNTYHNETCKIIDSSEGIVELQLCQKCLVKGENIVRLSILKDNEIANTPIITYEVRKGLYSDNPSFNDDPLTPILSQMLLDIKVTKVNQIELQERYEKSLPKIEGKIKEVESLINRVDTAIASGTQDLEVKEARVGENGKSYAKLGDRLNEVDSQLEQIVLRKTDDSLLGVVDNNTENGITSVLKIHTNQDSNKIPVQIYNNSGVKNDGSQASDDGQESIILHHYNNKTAVQLDNVGQDNTILKLKNAKNSTMSKHDSIGSGNYIECERYCADLKGVNHTITHDSSANRVVNLNADDLVYDKFSNSVYKSLTTRSNVDLWTEGFHDETKWIFIEGYGNEIMLKIKEENLKTMGLSRTDRIVPAIWGRIGGKLKNILSESIHFFSIGTTNVKGKPAISLYSSSNGGECLMAKNLSSSKGCLMDIENNSNQSVSYALRIVNKSPNRVQVIQNYTTAPFITLNNMTQNKADIIDVQDNEGNSIFKISSDAKTIFMTDTADNTLRSIRVTNGQLIVT